ncbi:glycosyltransferase family 9 protein [Halomonas aquatica]|uniref:Glycosyltransferase family 9 protein n=1 Tax=Halomonas aquatica TaxID=3151123 RepID=A0ABV1NGI5_9GAMM
MKKNVVALLRNRPFFGSRLTSLPALYQLKQAFPDHRLMLVGRGNDSSFYSLFDWVDCVIESKTLANDIIKIPHKPDVMVSFQPSSERGAITKIFKKPALSAGFSKNKNILSHIWDKRICFNNKEYRATHYLQLLDTMTPHGINIHQSLKAPFLDLASSDHLQTESLGKKFNIVLMPGGGAGEFKKWGCQSFIQAALFLAKTIDTKAQIHVILGPAETAEVNALGKMKTGNIKTHHSPNIFSLCNIISKSNLVIANDCGPSHIAQCLGLPYVGIYSHNNTEWFRVTDRSVMITPETGQDIKDISQDRVIKAALSVV